MLQKNAHTRMHTDKNLYLISREISNSLKSIQMTRVQVTKTQAAVKPKNFCTAKETLNKVKRQLWSERKYLQTMYLVNCPDYMKSSYSNKNTNDPVQKTGKGRPQTFLQRSYTRRPTNTEKDARHHTSSGKCKSKP